jgi:hypothetical protein
MASPSELEKRVKLALHRDELREQMVSEYLRTPSKRGVLAQSFHKPGWDLVRDIAQGESPAHLRRLEKILHAMDRLQSALTGGEVGLDLADFYKLYQELHQLKARFDAQKPKTGKTVWQMLDEGDPV